MRILINIMGNVSAGGWTYYENLVIALGKIESSHQYFLLMSSWQTHLKDELPPNFTRIIAGPTRKNAIKRMIWEQTALPGLLKEKQIDVLYSPGDMTTFLSPCPIVLGIQNPNPYANFGLEMGFGYILRFRFLRLITYLSAKRSHRVITVSEFSRQQVIAQLKLPAEKTQAVHHGIESVFFETDFPEEPPFKEYLPYILCVSTITEHKNYQRMLRAYEQLCADSTFKHHLCIVGAIKSKAEFLELQKITEHAGLSKRIHFFGRVDHFCLPRLYRDADLYVLPSLLETFGLTLVEAMACETPILASNCTSIPEIAGDAALYFDPTNTKEIAERVRELLNNPELRMLLIENGRKRLDHFSWGKTAQQMLDIFSEAYRR